MNRILTTILTTYYDLGVPYFRKPPYPVAWFTMLIMITINHISTRFDPINSRKQWWIPYPIYPVAIYDSNHISTIYHISTMIWKSGWYRIDQVNIIPHHSYITRSRCFDRNPAAVPIFTLRWSHGGFDKWIPDGFDDDQTTLCLVNIQKTMENVHRNSGFSHWKWLTWQILYGNSLW